MNTHYIVAMLAMTVLLFSTGAKAKQMSKTEYASAEKKIGAEYKSNRESCTLYAHDKYKRSCIAEAKSTRRAEEAELEARYKSTSSASYAAVKRR